VVAIVAIAGACSTASSPSPAAGSPAGSAAGSPAGSAAGSGATTVQVALSEWSVVPTPDSVPAGDVTFQVRNNGPDDVHEFVILKTDLAFDALPTDANGAVEESGSGIEVKDEIEDIPVGQTQEVTADLAAGKYVLLCNIYDETEQEAHYQQGMRLPFTVTG
jgi:uncharacterized cupredoxin-like copper-binding protein